MIDANEMPGLHGNAKVWVLGDCVKYPDWEKVTMGEARRRNACVITCGKHPERRAVKLDSLFPYHQEYNKCRECASRGGR